MIHKRLNLAKLDMKWWISSILETCRVLVVGEEANYITHVRAGWEKFRELLPLLTSRVCSYKLKGRSIKHVLKVLYHIEVNYGS